MKIRKLVLSTIALLPTILNSWSIPAVGVAALAISSPAYAYCVVNPVNYGLDCPDGPTDNPYVHPNPTPAPHPVWHYSLYMAAAISSRTGNVYGAYHYENLERVQNAAMSRCQAHASDCKLIQWTPHCLSVAQDKARSAWGTASDWTIEPAEAEAVHQCKLGGGKDCQVTWHHCSDDT